MMKIVNILFILTFFTSFPIPLSSADAIESISTKSAVIFNTLCAKCHEGECSGRLSFDTGSESASSHIKRYAGDANISRTEIKEFFALLNYMKKECALLMPDDGKWKQENLSRFALPSHDSYFIPLGHLKRGKYHLNIATKEEVHYRVEVLSDRFDPYVDQSACPEQKKNIRFTIDEPVNAFLRIRSKKPLHIITLEIIEDNE